jgi:hypothetical protein
MTDDLIARLRAMYSHRGDGIPTQYVNPDGPEAADALEALRGYAEALIKYAKHDGMCARIGGYGYCGCGVEAAADGYRTAFPEPRHD